MARRIIHNCVLACIAIFLFITLLAYFEQTPGTARTDGLFHEGPNGDESLQGAVSQKGGEGTPGPYQIDDPVNNNNKGGNQQQQKPAKADEPKKHVDPDEAKKQGAIPRPKPQWTFEVKDDVYFDPAGPRPDQVVLLMASDGKGHNGGIEGLLEMAMQNRKEYADFHGYHFQFINISRYDLSGAHPVWAKIPAILDTFIQYEDIHWVWWLDLDAILMNPDMDLNSHILSHAAMKTKFEAGVEFLKGGSKHTGHFMAKDMDPKNVDIIIGQDHNGLNAGSFFLRRSKFTKMFMDFWEDPFYVFNGWPGKEQDALLHMVQFHRQVREHTALVPQRVMNGFPVGWENMGWHTDDLVVHLAGCWVENQCNQRWKDYWGKRTTVDDLKAKGINTPSDHTGKVTKITPTGTIYVDLEPAGGDF